MYLFTSAFLSRRSHNFENMSIRLFQSISRPFRVVLTRSMSGGDFGSGAGKGGGSGGSIREAGGSFGKMEAAHEEEYFRKLRAQQFEQLKDHQKIEEQFHENQIKVHKDAIKAHKKAIENMKQRDSDSD